jgi:hypothetical protein
MTAAKAATLFAYILCEVAAHMTRVAFSSVHHLRWRDQCLGFFGRFGFFALPCVENVSRITAPSRYIPYGNE